MLLARKIEPDDPWCPFQRRILWFYDIFCFKGNWDQWLFTAVTTYWHFFAGTERLCCLYVYLPSMPFLTILIHKSKIFSWSYMTGHDGLRWHWALHFLCHRAVLLRKKAIFLTQESIFLQTLLRYLYTERKEESRFTDLFGFYQYKLKWSIKCMKMNAVFCACKSKLPTGSSHMESPPSVKGTRGDNEPWKKSIWTKIKTWLAHLPWEMC